jgi:predicted metal-dependent phosphoesterase TrpH
MGLDGIEAYYPGAKPRIWRRLSRLADKFDLIITGGSDYHGANKPDRRLGRLGKGRKIHDFFLEAFL